MRRRQTAFPQWWNDLHIPDRLREQVRATFTINRDGYVIWYNGRTRTVCGKTVAPADVQDRWLKKKEAIDAGAEYGPPNIYRDALADFLKMQRDRLVAAKNRIEHRTYHNYEVALNDFGNFVFEHRKVADTPLAELGPRVFAAYASKFNGWKASGFDSIVCRVGALFRWCVEMEYLDRYRPGPQFVRPAKQEIVDQRIDLTKSFEAQEIADLYVAANQTVRCWIALGLCAGFNNSDIAHLPRAVVDLESGIIDFRRRKSGKKRRVIPLPADLVDLLKRYQRPDPTDAVHAGLFFVSEYGNPYGRTRSRNGDYMPSDSVSRLFGRLMDDAKVERRRGRNFSGLRTTLFNWWPRGQWDLERKIVMGRATGTVDLDSYLEDVGLERIGHGVNEVWGRVKPLIESATINLPTHPLPLRPLP